MERSEIALHAPDGSLLMEGRDLSHAKLVQVLPVAPRCCTKCAFREGSPERPDPRKWLELAISFAHGATFLCHEGVPGHSERAEGIPLRLCGGRAAMDRKPIAHLCLPAISRTPDAADRADLLECLTAVRIAEVAGA